MLNTISTPLTSKYLTKELKLTDYKFYLFTLVFSIGNIALPLLCHQFNLAGNRFLPIYFFVLIAGYMYGWRLGLTTAILSPLFSYLLTGMPVMSLLSLVLIKGAFLGIIAGVIAFKSKQVIIFNLAVIIISYQFIGLVFGYLLNSNLNIMSSDLVLGFPGLLIQLFGGLLVIKLLKKYL